MAVTQERVAEQLVALRRQFGSEKRPLSQEDAAHRAGVTTRQWSRWENCESMPYTRSLNQVAEAFEVPIEFFDDGERPSAVELLDAGNADLAAELHGARQSIAALQEQSNEQGQLIRDLENVVRKQLVPLIARVNAEMDARKLSMKPATTPARAPRRSQRAS